MYNLPLDLMKAVVVFSHSPNISQAASRLGITQPALTKQLQLLEQQLPHKLFIQVGRKKILTPYGLEFCAAVEQRMAPLEQDLKLVNDRFDNPENIQIRVAGRHEILERMALKTSYPGRLHFIEMDGDQAMLELRERKIEIAISQDPPDSPVIHSKLFLSDKFILLFPKNWGRVQSIDELKTRPFVAYKEKLFNKKEIEGVSAFRTIADWRTIIKLVERGTGWSIVPTSFEFSHKRCSSLPYNPGISKGENRFYLLYFADFAKLSWFKKLIAEIQI